MKNILMLVCLSTAWGSLASTASAQPAGERKVSGQKPVIQMAILLDTSGSMSGLIDQARSQLWKIVNEFVLGKRDGQPADLRVALYEYGKSSIPQSEGYLRQIVPFTTDLDRVSEELFALRTNGGDEYCGKVIQAAVEGLQWSPSSGDLKVIFVAGNEPFTQGDVDYRVACKAAISRGIIVNTIHCGPHETGVQTGWKDGALLADGAYTSIDHNRAVVHIPAPQDPEIARLGAEINKTYVPYGALGKEGQLRQEAQDRNAVGSGAGSSTQRAVSKGSRLYRNVAWDLVDAVRERTVKLEDLKKEDLPPAMQKMSLEEQEEFLEARARERAKIQAQIQKLNEARKKHVAKVKREQSSSQEETLDEAVIKNLRQQAEKKGIEIE
jgi:hypothetical protein